MGAILAIPVIASIVSFFVSFGTVIASVAVAVSDAMAVASMAIPVTGAVFFAALEEGFLIGIGTVIAQGLATGAGLATFFKRDEGYGNYTNINIKFNFKPYDPGHVAPLKLALFNVTGVDNETGIADFLWSNSTVEGYGGKMTDIWLRNDGSVYFPDPFEDGPDEDGRYYPWYPNGTVTGEDASGAPMHGNWTTKLSHKDVDLFNNIQKKKQAMDRSRKMHEDLGVKPPCLHIKYGSTPDNYFYGQDSCRSQGLSKRDASRLNKRAEEEVGYKGDTALIDSLKAAFDAMQ